MQDRSRGSKRFELGDVPTRASIYQEDHTPAHWPPPTDANAVQRAPRTPRHGLIASQLGLQQYPPDSWQTQAAADGDWPLDHAYAASSGEQAAQAGYANYGFGEEGSYGEDAELQAALDLDNSQGLYDEQFGAYYAAANPPLDLRLPPVAAQPAQHDYRAYAQAYAEPWNQEDLETSHYARPGQHKVAARTAPTGKYPFAQVARQSSQPSAAKWQAQQPIQRVATPNTVRAPRKQAQPARNVAANPYAAAAAPRPTQQRAKAQAANVPVQNARAARANAGQSRPSATTNAPQQLHRAANTQTRNTPAQLNRTANTQLNRTANTQLHRSGSLQANHGATVQLNRAAAARRPAARSFIDDEPISYPKPRSSGWLKAFAFAICIAAGAYVARDQIAPVFLTTPAPRPQPTPVAAPAPAVPEAPAAAPAPEPATAPTPEVPAPQEDAKARRSATRAAIIAERWRERRAARRAQGEYDDTNDRDRPDTTASEPTQTTHYTPKPAPQLGILRINSRPWSNIFVDGQPVGHTPQMNLQLSAGQHQITLINNEMQLRKAVHVTITPGETTTQTVNLAE